jgi:signal transduction histidine kinase
MPARGLALAPIRVVGRRRTLAAPAPRLALMAALVAVYYAAAHIGYEFNFAGPVAAIVWLPIGVAIAFLYLGGLWLWPAVLAGDLLVNDYAALPLGSAIGQSAGNVLEAVVATWLLQRLAVDGQPLRSVAGVTRMLIALAAGTALSATIGTVSLGLGGVVHGGHVLTVWRTWWLGDAAGALLVVPLVIAWVVPERVRWGRRRAIEAGLLIAAVVGVSAVALGTDRPLTYLVFPALIWAALRFGPRGATAAIAVTAGFTLWNTTRSVGPFAYQSISHSTLSTQLFIAVTALTTLFLAAIVCEREDLAERLHASRTRVIEATDTERRRLSRNIHDGVQQRLVAAVVRLGLAAEQVGDDSADTEHAVREAGELVAVAVGELRDLAHGLHPRALTDHGLRGALESLAEQSVVPVVGFDVTGERLDEGVETTVYYVVAEAMANAQKHARAESLRILVRLDGDALDVGVADDGIGGASDGVGYGLRELRDRVESIGGRLRVDSPPGAGTRITAWIPVGS